MRSKLENKGNATVRYERIRYYSWWLRNTDENNNAACVTYKETIDKCPITSNNIGVRLAMWIEIQP